MQSKPTINIIKSVHEIIDAEKGENLSINFECNTQSYLQSKYSNYYPIYFI